MCLDHFNICSRAACASCITVLQSRVEQAAHSGIIPARLSCWEPHLLFCPTWQHSGGTTSAKKHSMLTSEASYREFMAATTVGTPTSHVVASLSFVTRKRNCWTRGASAAGSSAFRSSRPPCRTVNTSSPSVTELVKAMPSTRNGGSWAAFPG